MVLHMNSFLLYHDEKGEDALFSVCKRIISMHNTMRGAQSFMKNDNIAFISKGSCYQQFCFYPQLHEGDELHGIQSSILIAAKKDSWEVLALKHFFFFLMVNQTSCRIGL
ncbi:hypothetical protein AMTRI_Chr04g244280 [Amborella trichopoda]